MSRPLLCLAVLAVGLAACASDATADAEVHDLRLRMEGRRSFPTLTGYVVNLTDREISSADVFVTLYDDERPMTDVQVLVQNIAPRDSARFEKTLDVRARRAQLKLIATN